MHSTQQKNRLCIATGMVILLLNLGVSIQLKAMNPALVKNGKRSSEELQLADKVSNGNHQAVEPQELHRGGSKKHHPITPSLKKDKVDEDVKIVSMFDAVERGNFFDLVSLPQFITEDMFVRNQRGQTLLHRAAKIGHPWMVSLLERGAPIDAIERIDAEIQPEGIEPIGATALHLAADKGQKEVVEVLVLNGALLEVPDKRGYTPLHWAARNGHKEVVELLLWNGARINVGTREGDTALHLAVLNGKKEVVEVLLKWRAQILVNRDGLTPYHCAVNNGYRELAAHFF